MEPTYTRFPRFGAGDIVLTPMGSVGVVFSVGHSLTSDYLCKTRVWDTDSSDWLQTAYSYLERDLMNVGTLYTAMPDVHPWDLLKVLKEFEQ